MDPRVTPVALAHAHDVGLFGGKAVSLGAALRAGLPVPDGAALSVAFVEGVAASAADALDALRASAHVPRGRVAVRSSAVGEDSADSSFAGQHATHLNVLSDRLHAAVTAVWASGRSEAALAYRTQRGIAGAPAVAVVVQELVQPLVAGVLFTRNPMTGADERVIEATWGLGEAVVSGRVVPDYFRLDARGQLLEEVAGDKDVKIVGTEEGGVEELPLDGDDRYAPCLSASQLAGLFDLSQRCRTVWGDDLDLEWAIGSDGVCYLLQSRPITAGIRGA